MIDQGVKSYTKDCPHCREVFELTLTNQEFISSQLNPTQVTATCPHCQSKMICTVQIHGENTRISCRRIE